MFWIEDIEEGFWKGVNEESFEDRVYWRMNFWCGDFFWEKLLGKAVLELKMMIMIKTENPQKKHKHKHTKKEEEMETPTLLIETQ